MLNAVTKNLNFSTTIKRQVLQLLKKFTIYRNKLKSILLKAEKEYYAKNICAGKGDIKQTWKVLNHLLNKSGKPSVPTMEFKHNNDTISNGEEIAGNFNTFFSNIGKTLASKIQPSNQSFEDYLSKQSDLNVRPT